MQECISHFFLNFCFERQAMLSFHETSGHFQDPPGQWEII
jgi:hypothetical protein